MGITLVELVKLYSTYCPLAEEVHSALKGRQERESFWRYELAVSPDGKAIAF